MMKHVCLLAVLCVLGGTLAGCSSPGLATMTVTADTRTLAPGSTAQLVATGRYADGSVVDLTALVTWDTSDPAVATFSSAAGEEGLLTAVMAGDVSVTATYLDQHASFALHVTAGSGTLSALALSPSSATLLRGLTLQLAAQGTYSDMTTRDLTGMVSWSSSAPAVAQVNEKGLVTAMGAGDATITASLSGQSATSAIHVPSGNVTPMAVTVAPPSATIGHKGRQVFSASLTLSDGTRQDITEQAAWASSDPAVATISTDGTSRGVALAVSAGSATISASYGGKTGTAALTVLRSAVP